uniref:Uncharacterized protein n=1 Tax=Panagrolaimus sp. PS1159 TaxID=55785 RepID=A0AC35FD45_9BILA
MDFDPDHSKWQCCCCHLASGLKILGGVEILFSSIFIIAGIIDLSNSIQSATPDEEEYAFAIGLIITALTMAISSALLIFGIMKNKEKLMYPTLCARVLVVIFVTIFGVTEVVVNPAEEDAQEQSLEAKPKKRLQGKVMVDQDHPPVVLRLVFLVFLMIFLCIGIFYTIYLVVRCIRYVQAYTRLERRRASLIIAGQIDPEMLNGRRLSRASQI